MIGSFTIVDLSNFNIIINIIQNNKFICETKKWVKLLSLSKYIRDNSKRFN